MKIKTLVLFSFLWTSCSQQVTKIDLSGSWQFTTDSARWDNTIRLPGSMTSNGLGEDITVSTPWTGGIVDSAYFRSDAYARYRESGHIKVPFRQAGSNRTFTCFWSVVIGKLVCG